jgi:hypothetical protein
MDPPTQTGNGCVGWVSALLPFSARSWWQWSPGEFPSTGALLFHTHAMACYTHVFDHLCRWSDSKSRSVGTVLAARPARPMACILFQKRVKKWKGRFQRKEHRSLVSTQYLCYIFLAVRKIHNDRATKASSIILLALAWNIISTATVGDYSLGLLQFATLSSIYSLAYSALLHCTVSPLLIHKLLKRCADGLCMKSENI